ncbi:MAG: hypothetical protein JWP91_3329 [Fibrobacteres bacterium]|nr:hypothetical protein [Fibrobacterota bacterium]
MHLRIFVSITLAICAILGVEGNAAPVWTSPGKVTTVGTDECAGSASPVTFFTIGTDPNMYFFPSNSPAKSDWLSEIELAAASGMNLKVKYDNASVNPGSTCGFNPGYRAMVVVFTP